MPSRMNRTRAVISITRDVFVQETTFASLSTRYQSDKSSPLPIPLERGFEEISRLLPERTETFFLALPDKAHVSRGIEADGTRTEIQGLLDTSARVVQQRQQRVIPLAFRAGTGGFRQDRSDFRYVAIAYVAAAVAGGGGGAGCPQQLR